MVPKIAPRGRSFRGVSTYLFHDKAKADSADRVAWAETRNTWGETPEHAWFEMMNTWDQRHLLKEASGADRRGRDNKAPVLHYSLAWHPSETPDRAAMMAAAEASLAVLGLEDHQAFMVAHTDEAHPHVHIVVNTVNPSTGRTAPLKFSKERLSEWAEAYEIEHGLFCEERVKNNDKRRKAKEERKRDPDQPYQKVKDSSPTRPEWEAAADIDGLVQDHAAENDDLEPATLWEKQKAERDVLEAQTKQLASMTRTHVKGEFKQAWRDLYEAHAADDALLGDDVSYQGDGRDVQPADILAQLTAQHSTFTRADLARALHKVVPDQASFHQALSAVEADPQLVSLGKAEDGRERLTTLDMQATERRLAGYADGLVDRLGHGVSPWHKLAALKDGRLGADQLRAFDLVTGGGDLNLIVGFAGTGKSTMLAAARQAWEASGYTVQGAALSGIAAESLEGGSGITSRSLASLEHAWKSGRQQLGTKSILVVDEAGMVGSRQLERLLARASEAGAKVVLVGDPEQLQAIDAGAAFRALSDRLGAAEMTTVRRQREEWQQEATKALATGRTAEALDAYDKAGAVHAHPTREAARAALVEAWHTDRQRRPDMSQVILAPSRADVADLNEKARAMVRQHGGLGADVTISTEAGKRQFAQGDRLMFLQNDRALGVKNGTLGTLEKIGDGEMSVRLDGRDGSLVAFSTADYAHIAHGYASTVHKAQGVTVDKAHVLATDAMDRQSAYVALTRHREGVTLHWAEDDLKNRDRLTSRLSRDRSKDTTLDYGNPQAYRPDRLLRSDRDRAEYIFAHADRLAAGGKPLTSADMAALAGSHDALAKQVKAAQRHERAELAAGQNTRARALTEQVWKRHREGFSVVQKRQAAERAQDRAKQQDTAGRSTAEPVKGGFDPTAKDRAVKTALAKKARLAREGRKGFGREFEP